jgi:hypothetical protein
MRLGITKQEPGLNRTADTCQLQQRIWSGSQARVAQPSLLDGLSAEAASGHHFPDSTVTKRVVANGVGGLYHYAEALPAMALSTQVMERP